GIRRSGPRCDTSQGACAHGGRRRRGAAVPGSTTTSSPIASSNRSTSSKANESGGAMTRSGVLVCAAICGVVAGCGSSPSAPSGVPVFAEGRVSMTFTPQDQTFAEAADAYRRVWVAEGSAIVDAMERGTGLTFLERHVDAVIFEGVSQSGRSDSPMYL